MNKIRLLIMTSVMTLSMSNSSEYRKCTNKQNLLWYSFGALSLGKNKKNCKITVLFTKEFCKYEIEP